jgi:hypothetical protein
MFWIAFLVLVAADALLGRQQRASFRRPRRITPMNVLPREDSRLQRRPWLRGPFSLMCASCFDIAVCFASNSWPVSGALLALCAAAAVVFSFACLALDAWYHVHTGEPFYRWLLPSTEARLLAAATGTTGPVFRLCLWCSV